MELLFTRDHSSWTSGLMAISVILMLFKPNTVFSQSDSIYNSGIQYSAYGGGKSFPSHIVEYKDNHQIHDDQISKFEARSAKRNQPQQVDEGMVASMLNNPDAMKMVLKYLTKQNLNEHQKKWDSMSHTKKSSKNQRKKSSAKKKTTARPTTTTKKPKKSKTKSPILQITQIKRRNDDVQKSNGKDNKKNKRRPRPKGDFFDLAQLFKLASLGSQPNNRKKSQKDSKNDKSDHHQIYPFFLVHLSKTGHPRTEKLVPNQLHQQILMI